MIPVLVDTDIGSDIDDALAIAYLALHPSCHLLGITTVSGDVQQRAACAEVILRASEREDVPIHCGRRDPLLVGPGQPKVPQYDKIKHLPHRLDRPENTAVEFLNRTIRSRPGEIVLLTIGPFSNIALLFSTYPDIPYLLKDTVSMAGTFFPSDELGAGSSAQMDKVLAQHVKSEYEWNAHVDSTATSMVYRTTRKSHKTLGLDVTVPCRMTVAEVRERFTEEPLKTAMLMAEAWFETRDVLTFHDPLAAAYIFNPDLCEMVKGRIQVDEKDGKMNFDGGKGSDSVGRKVVVGRFMEEFFSITRAG